MGNPFTHLDLPLEHFRHNMPPRTRQHGHNRRTAKAKASHNLLIDRRLGQPIGHVIERAGKHTDLAGTAREISRVLKPDGRAAFIEPQKANPFAWIYRRTLAPKSWRAITRYFDAEAQRTCIKLIGEGSVRPFYLFSFLAFAFQFAWPNVGRFFGTLRFLHKIDQWLFSRMRWTRSLAWFGVIEVKKGRQIDSDER